MGGREVGRGEGKRGEGIFPDSFPFPFPGFLCGWVREIRVVRVG